MTRPATPPAHESRVPTDQAVPVAGLLAWLREARPDPAYCETPHAHGVVTGFDMVIAQLEEGHLQQWIAEHAAFATFDQAVPSGVDGLVEAAQKIGALPAGFLKKPGIEWILLDGTELTDADVLQRAALSPVPASASDAELIARLRAVRDWWRAPGLYAEQAADRLEALTKSPPQEDHFHCPNGCEKVVFEHEDRPVPTCIRCGAEWVRCDEDICHLNAKSPPQETSDGEPPCQ